MSVDPPHDPFLGTVDTLDGIVEALQRSEEALRITEAHLRALDDVLPGVVWSADADGMLDYIGDRWSETRGRPTSQGHGNGWLDAVHPEDREATRARWTRSIRSGEPYEAEFRVRMADGAYRWQLVRAKALRDPTGRVTRWAGLNVDIEAQKQADAAREKFVALAESSSDIIVLANLAGAIEYANGAGNALLGFASLAEARAATFRDRLVAADQRLFDTHIQPALERAGAWNGVVHVRDAASNAAIPMDANLFRLVDARDAAIGYAVVCRDLREAIRVERGLRLLSRAGAATVETLDSAATLENLVNAVVAEFASYCIIDVIDPAHGVRRTAYHRDRAKRVLLEQLSTPQADHPIARALAGESTFTTIDESWVRRTRGAEDRLEAIRLLDVRCVAIVPVVKPNGEIVGALTAGLDRTAAREDYGRNDLVFLEEVGRRAGAAIANARLYERERRIAVEFQAAALPASLPAFPNVLLDAEYLPGSGESFVGGDWFDAFVLADGRLAITVGDVIGHGLHAAVTMMKLRQAMQAAAMLAPEPNAMLDVADRTLRAIDADAYATAVAAIYDPAACTIALASAGHPAPILRTRDGACAFLDASGMMLGLRDVGAEPNAQLIAVPPGTTIAFYTDGLTEATRDLARGAERLLAAMAEPALVAADRPARLLAATVLGDTVSPDDVAVLVMRIA
jgi:PAS domain S-box-containing protein